MFSGKQSSPHDTHSQSKKKITFRSVGNNCISFLAIFIIGTSVAYYFLLPTPVYMEYDEGIVSEDDFEESHEINVLHHAWLFCKKPIMLVEPDCIYVQELADEFRCDNDRWTLFRILMWISKNIDYESDEVLYGMKDYWALPCETLYYMKGDCEDYAILFCSIAVACGLDVCLLQYPSHISAGVYMEGHLFFCDLYAGSIHESLEWEGSEPDIIPIDPSLLNKVTTVFAWTNKWMHKGLDPILP